MATDGGKERGGGEIRMCVLLCVCVRVGIHHCTSLSQLASEYASAYLRMFANGISVSAHTTTYLPPPLTPK